MKRPRRNNTISTRLDYVGATLFDVAALCAVFVGAFTIGRYTAWPQPEPTPAAQYDDGLHSLIVEGQ